MSADEELLELASEFKEYMLAATTNFPDIKGKDIWDKLYYAGMLPGILRFFLARENHLKEDLKVVGEGDGSMLRKSPEDELHLAFAEYREDYARASRLLEMGNVSVGDAEKLEKLADDRVIAFIKSRDQRIALEARIDERKQVKMYNELTWTGEQENNGRIDVLEEELSTLKHSQKEE